MKRTATFIHSFDNGNNFHCVVLDSEMNIIRGKITKNKASFEAFKKKELNKIEFGFEHRLILNNNLTHLN